MRNKCKYKAWSGSKVNRKVYIRRKENEKEREGIFGAMQMRKHGYKDTLFI